MKERSEAGRASKCMGMGKKQHKDLSRLGKGKS